MMVVMVMRVVLREAGRLFCYYLLIYFLLRVRRQENEACSNRGEGGRKSGSTMRLGALRYDTVWCDGMRGDRMRGDVMRGGVMK